MAVSRKKRVLIAPVLFGLFLISLNNVCCAELVFTLSEAERCAVNSAPELQKLMANTHALNEKAVADGQLPDPKLIFGTVNVPTNSFSFTQDDMTMINFGLQQALPPGRSLKIKSQQTRYLATAEQKKIQLQKLIILRNVREAWLDLYYWIQATDIFKKNQVLFQLLLKTTQSQYAANKGSQSDVLQAQLELSRFENQLAQTRQNLAIAEAQLRRWLTEINENFVFEVALPCWPTPPTLDMFKEILLAHPVLAVDKATIDAASAEVAWAKEQYKPGLMVDVTYSLRQGTFTDGSSHRTDMVSANVTLDLPIFRGNRQDRRLCASSYQFEEAQFEQHIHFLDLQRELAIQYATWEGFSERKDLFRQQLIPESEQNSKIALSYYQNATTDFATVLRARNSELATQLEYLQMQIEQAKARAALLYLEGDCE